MNTISSIEGSVERQSAGPKPGRWIVGTFAGWTVGFVLALVCIIGVESLGIRETQFPLALGMAAAVGYEVLGHACTCGVTLILRYALMKSLTS